MLDKVGVFVSHHHSPEEDAFTDRLVTDLRAAGADVWVDDDNIQSDSFIQKINQGLADRDWFVLVMTPASLGSKWVMREVDAAFNLLNSGQMQSVIPIIAQPCDVNDIPPLLRPLQRYDATRDYHLAVGKLLRALGLAGPGSAPTVPIPFQPTLSATPPQPSSPAPSDTATQTEIRTDASVPSGSPRSRVPRKAALLAAVLLLMTSVAGGLTFVAAGHLWGGTTPKTPSTVSSPTSTTEPTPSPSPTLTATPKPTATSAPVYHPWTWLSHSPLTLPQYVCTNYATPAPPPYSNAFTLQNTPNPDTVTVNWTVQVSSYADPGDWTPNLSSGTLVANQQVTVTLTGQHRLTTGQDLTVTLSWTPGKSGGGPGEYIEGRTC